MRSSRAESRSGRESVFTRPAHLDALVARVEAGESFAHEDDDGGLEHDRNDRYSDRYGDRYGDDDSPVRDRYNDRYGDRASLRSPDSSRDRETSMRKTEGSAPVIRELENELEDTRRELTGAHMQDDQMQGQLRSLKTELELHKKHCQEFKTMLELTESDLAEAQENGGLLSHRLQLAQEASRRNADMAQQARPRPGAAVSPSPAWPCAPLSPAPLPSPGRGRQQRR